MAVSNNGTKVPQVTRKPAVILDTVKARIEVTRQIKIAAAEEERFIYEVLEDAWNLYRAKKAPATQGPGDSAGKASSAA